MKDNPQVDFFATVHGDSSLSENPQRFYNDILVQKDYNVTLTCTAKGPKETPVWASSDYPYYYPKEMNWFVNSKHLEMAICTYEKPSQNKTCILNLGKVQPDDRGIYFCQAVSQQGCTYKELNLTVTGGYNTTAGSRE